jgi:hypothetical protein
MNCMRVCFIEINNSIKADEKVVMTYVSSYYHAFSTTQKVILCMKCDILFNLIKKNLLFFRSIG